MKIWPILLIFTWSGFAQDRFKVTFEPRQTIVESMKKNDQQFVIELINKSSVPVAGKFIQKGSMIDFFRIKPDEFKVVEFEKVKGNEEVSIKVINPPMEVIPLKSGKKKYVIK